MPPQRHKLLDIIRGASLGPVEPIEDILSDSVFLRSGDENDCVGGDSGEYNYAGKILECPSLPINDTNIPADAHYETESKSESGEVGERRGEYEYDSDSASNYSQDSDYTFDTGPSTHQRHGHDINFDVGDCNPPTPSDSQTEQDDLQGHSGSTTPSPTSAPTEHLTNVLQHGLQSRNRRLNRRRVSLPPPLEDDQPTFEPLSIQNLCASRPVEEYLDIVETVWIKVFVETHPPYQWNESWD